MMVDKTILNQPDHLLVQTDEGWVNLMDSGAQLFVHKDIEILANYVQESLELHLQTEKTQVKRVIVRWIHDASGPVRVLGDHWERGYGDLEWRGIVPERVMPWYFFINDGVSTHGYGVKTGPNALCFWQINERFISLCMDVRCGTRGVSLFGKKLLLAEVVSRKGMPGEAPYKAAREFCRQMCDSPKLPGFPVYGGNNWYQAYGRSNEREILEDSARISHWADSSSNRPFMVIDACWQEIFVNDEPSSGGPWYRGNQDFPDMGALAGRMKEAGVRPGLWYRPLLTMEKVPRGWLFGQNRFKNIEYPGEIMDPSIPEVLQHIEKDVERFVGWGFDLIKHDFSTFDILGRWGFSMGMQLTDEGWSFADGTRTTAQIIKGLYEAIARGAGKALIIGCNTVSHLSAGLFHLQRTGDDTSGWEWERTRKMGVNTLAFRMAQHDTFYAADADCVGLTTNVPWHLNKQWLELLSKSGTPLFVSAATNALGAEQEKAIREAFSAASKPLPAAEPLDWLETTCPSKWLIEGKETIFNWNDPTHRLEYDYR